jgi:hypothetical protein
MRRTKCQSGAEKKRKKQRLDAVTQSLKGALDKFVVKKPQANSENQTRVVDVDDDHGDTATEVDANSVEFDEGDDGDSSDEHTDASTDNEGDNANGNDEGNDASAGVEGTDAIGVDGTDTSFGLLKFLEKRPFYPFANIAYRILLTIPVTVASAERSFSKLKLLKSYMRSTMTQERLSGLATIALENDILEKINYKDMIEDFISRNSRRMMLFGRP